MVRRLGKNWWVWGSVVSVMFIAFVALIAPVFIFPLFNKYTKLEDPRIQGADPESGAGQRNSRD